MNRVEKEMPVDWRSEPWSSSSSTCNQQLRSKKAGKRKCIPSEFFSLFTIPIYREASPLFFCRMLLCLLLYLTVFTNNHNKYLISIFHAKKRKKNGFCLFCNFSNFQTKSETFFCRFSIIVNLALI